MISFCFLNNARISKRHLSLEIKSENSPGVVPVNQVVGVARILVKLPHRVVTESSHSKHLVLRLSEQLAKTRQDRMQLHGGKDGWLVQVPGTEVDVDDQLLCRASWGSLCPRNRPQYFHTHWPWWTAWEWYTQVSAHPGHVTPISCQASSHLVLSGGAKNCLCSPLARAPSPS